MIAEANDRSPQSSLFRRCLAPGSAVGEKGKTRSQIEKILASEVIPAVVWGGGKVRPPLSPHQTTSRLASLADLFFLFPSMLSLVPG